MKGRILIVEDDRDIGEMLKHYFSYKGFEVLYAVRGNDAPGAFPAKAAECGRLGHYAAGHGWL